MRGRLAVLIVAALLTLPPVNSPDVSEAAKPCTVADLHGTYVFTATGFGTPPGGSSPTAPKALIEVFSFNGDGTVDTPKVHTEREWHNHQRRPGELRHLHRGYVDCGNCGANGIRTHVDIAARFCTVSRTCGASPFDD
jgi:hypothetical protein